jgi:hypothetical protein
VADQEALLSICRTLGDFLLNLSQGFYFFQFLQAIPAFRILPTDIPSLLAVAVDNLLDPICINRPYSTKNGNS